MVEPTLRSSVGADVLDCLEVSRRKAATSIFLDAAARLSSAVPHVLEPTEASRLFRARIERQPWYAHRIDYTQEATDFNKAFFLKNFYKCLLLLTYTDVAMYRRPINVADVGAGAGTFSIAWQLLRGEDNILMIDTSDRQLSLAARFAEALRLSNRVSICSAFPSEIAAAQRLRLASYWFCEQNLDVLLADKESFREIIGPGAIVVDYSDVIERIFLAFPRSYDVVGRWRVTAALSPEVVRFIGENYIRVHGIYVKPANDR